MNPPVAPKIPTSKTYHGSRTLSDDYAWLRQDNWKEMFADTGLLDGAIRAYLAAENEFTQSQLIAPHQALIDTLIVEMKARTEIDFDTAPVQDGGYAYFARLSAADYPIFLRRDGSGHEQTILDVTTELASGGRKIFLGDLAHSDDHRYLAIAVDYSGSEDHDITIKDLTAGKFIDDRLSHADSIVWHPAGDRFFYARMSDKDGEFRRDRVFLHIIGTTQDKDTLILQSDDTSVFLGVSRTSDRRYLKISLGNTQASETHLLDMSAPDGILVCPAPLSDGILYSLDHAHGVFYIHTNADDAVEFKVMTAPAVTPQRKHWIEKIPHQPGRLIEAVKTFTGHLVRAEYENCLPRIVIENLGSGVSHAVDFDDPAYAVDFGSAAGFSSALLRLTYSSPRMPAQNFDYDMDSRARTLVRQQKIPGHDPEKYVVERLFVPAADGARIPLTLLRGKDAPRDGSAPAYLYGYGSYGHGLDAHFAGPFRYALADRGFIVVDVHVRGGSDMGRQWYLNGKLLQKKNTFTDFIAAAEWLVNNRYTARGSIAAMGGSAGGLLVGAVANMAPPGLFGCMVADVPFVDVMNTILDATLPLTPPEWQEWGNPVTDAAAFDYMLSYSPYDNVTAKPYPALFIAGGLTDPRVTYWEPAKWTAKLRAMNTGTQPVYMYISMDSGHGGNPGRFSHLPELARELAFILTNTGRGA